MFELTTLGRIDLTGPEERRIQSVLQQTKRLGLLAYLCIESAGSVVRRDALLGIFWPEADTATARNRLKQSLFFLRRSLHPDALPSIGPDGLRVDPSIVKCDVSALVAAYHAGKWADVLDLYGGDLLPAFFIAESTEFDVWLERQRAGLRAMLADAGLRLAGDAMVKGNAVTAVRAASRVLDLGTYDESVVRQCFHVLAKAGDRAEVAAAYERFERRLSTELDLEPDPETQAVVKELCSAGGPTAPPGPSSKQTAFGTRSDPLVEPPHPTRRSRSTAFAAVVATVVVAALGWWWAAAWLGHTPDSGVADVAPTVVLSPFEASNDVAMETARILDSLLRHNLTQVHGVSVHLSHVPHVASPPDAPFAATFAVDGAVRPEHEAWVADVSLVDVGDGRLLWSTSVKRSQANPSASDEIAHEVTSLLRSAIGREIQARRRLAHTGIDSVRTLMALADEVRQKARPLRTRGLEDVARRALAEADSLLALAQAAAPSLPGPIMERAQVAAEQAWLALLGPPADTALARRHFERALDLASRAVANGPDDPGALETRGMIAHRLEALATVDEGRGAVLIASARADLQRAVELDRTRIRAWTLLSDLAHREGDFAGALWMATTAYELDRYLENVQEVLLRLVASAHEVGDDAAADRWCEEIQTRFPDEITASYCALVLMAWSDVRPTEVAAAWRLIEPLKARPSAASLLPRFELLVASILAGAGMADSANVVLTRAIHAGEGDPELLQLEAHVRLRLGQTDSARVLLDRYTNGKPAARAHVARSRRFSALGLDSRAEMHYGHTHRPSTQIHSPLSWWEPGPVGDRSEQPAAEEIQTAAPINSSSPIRCFRSWCDRGIRTSATASSFPSKMDRPVTAGTSVSSANLARPVAATDKSRYGGPRTHPAPPRRRGFLSQ